MERRRRRRSDVRDKTRQMEGKNKKNVRKIAKERKKFQNKKRSKEIKKKDAQIFIKKRIEEQIEK